MKISAATTDPLNLLFDRQALDAARVVAVLVPGAFTRVSIFEAADAWRASGYGLVHYRFPGLDGRALSPPLDIARAADDIRRLLARYPEKPIRLLGYSTGGPIVLTAAAQLSGDVKVAVMSPAVERGGGMQTTLRVGRDLARAALAVRSTRLEPVWLSYYRVLLFGRNVWDDPDLAARAQTIVEARRDRIVLPKAAKRRAHTRDLRHWHVPATARYGPDKARFFWGMEDPVFARDQVLGLAAKAGAGVTGYPDQGHLLFASHPPVFEDIFAFFEGHSSVAGGGVSLT